MEGEATRPRDAPQIEGSEVSVRMSMEQSAPTPYIPDVSGIEETYLSDEIIAACEKWGEEYHILPELLEAMVEKESSGDKDAYNGVDAGCLQVAKRWHYDRMERLGCPDLFDVDQNIHVGADYLAELFDRYEDVYLVLMVYNMGDETALGHYENGVYSEYAQEITSRAWELEVLHEYGG